MPEIETPNDESLPNDKDTAPKPAAIEEPAPVDPAAAALAAVQPSGNPEVDKLVEAALAAALPNALKAALDAQQAQAQREAAAKAAKEQGDYKTLYEQSERDRKILELNKWRGEALREAKLDDKWFDSIQGETKEEMVAFAKKFKKQLDDDVANILAQTRDNSIGTPRGGGRATRTRTDKPTGAQKTGAALGLAFGAHRLNRA